MNSSQKGTPFACILQQAISLLEWSSPAINAWTGTLFPSLSDLIMPEREQMLAYAPLPPVLPMGITANCVAAGREPLAARPIGTRLWIGYQSCHLFALLVGSPITGCPLDNE